MVIVVTVNCGPIFFNELSKPGCIVKVQQVMDKWYSLKTNTKKLLIVTIKLAMTQKHGNNKLFSTMHMHARHPLELNVHLTPTLVSKLEDLALEHLEKGIAQKLVISPQGVKKEM